MFHYLSREQEIQVESWLSQLTLPEKISLLSGADNWSGRRGTLRLGIPSVIVMTVHTAYARTAPAAADPRGRPTLT